MSSNGYKIVERTIRSVWPKVPVAPSLTVGNTDTRHYWDLTDTLLRFSPIVINNADIARIHGIDERIGLETYHNNVDFYYHLIKNM